MRTILLHGLMQEKYRGYHPRLPIVVAETLLASDPQIELPLWLVKMFKVSILNYLILRVVVLRDFYVNLITINRI